MGVHWDFMKSLPWVPQVAIIDARFIVNNRHANTTTEYAHLLSDRFAWEHFKAGVKEVHLIFDIPGGRTFNPKQFQPAKQYTKENGANDMNIYIYIPFTSQTSIPKGDISTWSVGSANSQFLRLLAFHFYRCLR